MPLFQNSVITKYLQAQNRERIAAQWNVFKSHFLNPVIQENIRLSKEEQYQGEFLIDLFVKVLGYTKNPEPNFNLTTEYKNIKDSKKADGAILLQQGAEAPCVVGVIELKGTQLVLDCSKLVIGDAENKLFMGPLSTYNKEQIEIFKQIAANCRGNVWVVLIPHPEEWEYPGVTNIKDIY